MLEEFKKDRKYLIGKKHTFWTKVPQFSSIGGKWIPANLNRVSSPKTRDEEKLRLPISIRCGKGLY